MVIILELANMNRIEREHNEETKEIIEADIQNCPNRIVALKI